MPEKKKMKSDANLTKTRFISIKTIFAFFAFYIHEHIAKNQKKKATKKMPARPRFLHGFCKGGRLEPAGGDKWRLLFQGKNKFRQVFSTLKEAKRERRKRCYRLGLVVNPWRVWPDDKSGKTIQMRLGTKSTVLVEDDAFDLVASYLWKIRPDGLVIVSGKFHNTRAGVNSVAPTVRTNNKCPTLKGLLYPGTRVRFVQDSFVDAQGIKCHDFRLTNVRE